MSVLRIKGQVIHVSENMTHEEIISISKGAGLESNQEIVENAKRIAMGFLKENDLTEPITLARASFYVAIKESVGVTDEIIKLLIHNNGKTNRWWMYLVPFVEKLSTRR